ncbi:TetR family transcriptional regulator [Agrococcus sp. SL85]|uniref:TetR/AcrR family transcriptional regulator n=1 Tax=Agrococcus sp. SL85 TaxID=2995141 RepID=UPI00226D2879|nr:TetR family transcriptional regulator [Agrococcus sp. SL85]WAC65530.1 TetR family transcriptional regulator [Agrococcus sp. SL85]
MTRRTDPDRRDRIVEACLDVLVEHGVAGASHRRVAAAADVPLGSMTYHFAGFGALLAEAFGRFAAEAAARFEAALADAEGPEAAVDAAASLVHGTVLGTRRELVLTQELYTLAARDERFRAITAAWMLRSRAALERHLDPEAARGVDALMEGLTLHRALDAHGVAHGAEHDDAGAAPDPRMLLRRVAGLVD